jgi:hypothetical protein
MLAHVRYRNLPRTPPWGNPRTVSHIRYTIRPMHESSVPFDDMAMKPTAVRLSDEIRKVLQEEADYEGISLSQYLREAALMRAWYARGARGEDGEALRELEKLLRR